MLQLKPVLVIIISKETYKTTKLKNIVLSLKIVIHLKVGARTYRSWNRIVLWQRIFQKDAALGTFMRFQKIIF
jgi:hypothetical protein